MLRWMGPLRWNSYAAEWESLKLGGLTFSLAFILLILLPLKYMFCKVGRFTPINISPRRGEGASFSGLLQAEMLHGEGVSGGNQAKTWANVTLSKGRTTAFCPSQHTESQLGQRSRCNLPRRQVRYWHHPRHSQDSVRSAHAQFPLVNMDQVSVAEVKCMGLSFYLKTCACQIGSASG